MKKFILKGKQYLSKKLEELDIATEEIDVVQEQIPSRLKEPFKVLKNTQIDLESSDLYESYFRNYPTHHLSQFLLEKYELCLSANTPSPGYQFPSEDQSIFVPPFDAELEYKALLLKETIEEYDEGYTKVEEPVTCIAVIQFHHKRGTEIEYTYPKSKAVEAIENLMVHHAMPDSSHNKNEDYNFFNFEAMHNGRRRMLFGVSCFKQIRVTEHMKNNDKEITRSFVQKAVAVVSSLPLFGYLKMRLMVITKIFFSDFTNYEIIDSAYKDLNQHLVETWPQLTINELYIGSDLKIIMNLFGVSEFYEIWKAVLHQRRIVVFAHSSSSASSFILSLLTLFPGMSPFGMYSKPISKCMQALREYALPLRLFSHKNFMSMSFHIQDFERLSKSPKECKDGFLLGTTNRLLKESNDYGIQMLINLENCSVQRRKSRLPWQVQTKKEKVFVSVLEQIVETEKSHGYCGSEEMIRDHFHTFLKRQLVQMIKSISSFRQFLSACKEYQQSRRSPRGESKHKHGQDYAKMEDEQEAANEYTKGDNDYPPIISSEVTGIPFPNLLLCSSFSYFLQFHNPQMPDILGETSTPQLQIEGYDYVLRLNPNEFISYNWLDKKLAFGKGKTNSYQGKEIKFMHGDNTSRAKSIYIGFLENYRYEKTGYCYDKNEVYEGDYHHGVKQGYGKLKNTIHKYIGNFENNLYSGQGQLLTGKDLYVGEFREGLRHGCGKNQGAMTYDGEWANNYPHGSGCLSIEGSQYIGMFEKGELMEDAEITIRFDNGGMYKGFVRNKIPEGRGCMIDEHGVMQTGIFQAGKLVEVMNVARQADREPDEAGTAKSEISEKNR